MTSKHSARENPQILIDQFERKSNSVLGDYREASPNTKEVSKLGIRDKARHEPASLMSKFNFIRHSQTSSIMGLRSSVSSIQPGAETSEYESGLEPSNDYDISILRERHAKHFKAKAIKENVDLVSMLPCNVNFVHGINEVMVQGKSILRSEVQAAMRIPEKQRVLIDRRLFKSKEPAEEVIAEKYEAKHLYFV